MAKSLAQRRTPPSTTTSKSIWINALVLVLTLVFITFNTWGALHFVLSRQQEAVQTTHWLDASHLPPNTRSSPYGLFVPEGGAVALPSIRTNSDEEATIKRNFYGGRGDKAHLGGFTSFDPMGVSPSVSDFSCSVGAICHVF